MNTAKLVITVLILILVGVGLYSWSNQNAMTEAEQMMLDEPATDTSVEEVMEGEVMEEEVMEGESMSQNGSYIPYANDKLALAETGKVVLFFHASWCPTCRTLDKNIRNNQENIPEGVTILDVDYDNSTDLKKKYGVTYQHTLVQVDSQGELIDKWSGSTTLTEVVAKLK